MRYPTHIENRKPLPGHGRSVRTVAAALCILILLSVCGCNVGYVRPEPLPGTHPDGNTIETRFDPPEGYVRVELDENSFGAFLRSYPLKAYGTLPRLYTGEFSPEAASPGVFAQPSPLAPAQQCADTAMMLYAEYLFAQKREDEIAFRFLSGFLCDFKTWADGYRVVVDGSDVRWEYRAGKGGVKAGDRSEQNLRSYLLTVYNYANTSSLASQSAGVPASELRPGDFFVANAEELKAQTAKVDPARAEEIQYGHLILIADMAVNEKGETCFLYVQGTTPATECCVGLNPDGVSGVWFFPDADGSFVKDAYGVRWLPEWLRRFQTSVTD